MLENKTTAFLFKNYSTGCKKYFVKGMVYKTSNHALSPQNKIKNCSSLLNATDTGRAVPIWPARPMVMDFLWTYTAPNGRKQNIK